MTNGISYTTISLQGRCTQYYYDETRGYYVEVWEHDNNTYEALFTINNFWPMPTTMSKL